MQIVELTFHLTTLSCYMVTSLTGSSTQYGLLFSQNVVIAWTLISLHDVAKFQSLALLLAQILCIGRGLLCRACRRALKWFSLLRIISRKFVTETWKRLTVWGCLYRVHFLFFLSVYLLWMELFNHSFVRTDDNVGFSTPRDETSKWFLDAQKDWKHIHICQYSCSRNGDRGPQHDCRWKQQWRTPFASGQFDPYIIMFIVLWSPWIIIIIWVRVPGRNCNIIQHHRQIF